jgi:hypothetical protein
VDERPPPRRGPVVAVVLLTVALIASTSIAVWQYVELQRARDRIEELEASGGEGGGGGGLLDELQEALEDLLGGLGGASDPQGGAPLDCLAPSEPFSASAPTGSVQQQVAAIARQVEEIRELEFSRPADAEFVSPEETSSRVQDLFREEYTEAIGDAEDRILTALGAIPPDVDIRELRSSIYGQQVAGYYDPETGELVIRQAGPDLTVNDRIVLAHELDHALTDQALGLPVPDDLRAGHEDADLAATALVEGDATLVMQRYALSLPLEEQLGGFDPSALTEMVEAQADVARLPPYLAAELTFPYEEGLAFVCDLYAQGGWDAVNAAYDDPPSSSVEILVPDLYRERVQPTDPRDPGTLRDPWRLTARMQLGAAQLLWLFQAPGGDRSRALDDPRAAVEAWGGGELWLWTRGADSAVGLALAERPGGDLCSAVTEWYGSAFQADRQTGGAGDLVADGTDQDAVVACSDDEVRVGIGPEMTTAEVLVR